MITLKWLFWRFKLKNKMAENVNMKPIFYQWLLVIIIIFLIMELHTTIWSNVK